MVRHAAEGRLHLLPTSEAGRWSLRLLGLSLAGFTVFYVLVGAGERGDNPLLVASIMVALPGALAAGVAGIVAALRRHERGLVVGAPILFGLFWSCMLVGEFTNPH